MLSIAETALHGTGEAFAAGNALAISKGASSNGRGILLGNPHYPWTSTDRFFQLHATIPGSYDEMGVRLCCLRQKRRAFYFSPLYGPVGVAQHLRTRSCLIGIEDMLARRRQVGPDDVQALLLANRDLAAELVLPELLLQACTVLANWDRKANLDSRGAVLFREFWNRAAPAAVRPTLWRAPGRLSGGAAPTPCAR